MGTNGKNKDLSTRMKEYEGVYKYKITPRSYVIIRLDGKNFSNYTKNLDRPFDKDFSYAMDETAKALCKEFNCKFAYTQSDEISLVITEIGNIEAEPIFGNKLQKLCSLTASVATAEFNRVRNQQFLKQVAIDGGDMTSLEETWSNMHNGMQFPKQAHFDSRVFIVPNINEVMNHMIWRNRDCVRNSISMASQSVYSHKELQGKNSNEQQEMLFQKGINWSKYPSKFKDGLLIVKEEYDKNVDTPNGLVIAKRKRLVTTEYSVELMKKLIPIN